MTLYYFVKNNTFFRYLTTCNKITYMYVCNKLTKRFQVRYSCTYTMYNVPYYVVNKFNRKFIY